MVCKITTVVILIYLLLSQYLELSVPFCCTNLELSTLIQVPGTFTSSMRDYTDNMCWIKNTYYIPLDEVIPNKDEDIRTEINYYQWVPIVLIVQALLFYLPYMVSISLYF